MAKSIKNILISQNAPADMEQSQYKILVDKYNLKLTFNKFFEVVRISNKEYRAQHIDLLDYSAVIMTSKMAVDNYFHFAKEMRLVIPDDMKFFCVTDSIANYLQTYIQYRKRKIFYGKLTFDELIDVMKKHSTEKFLFPCAEDASPSNFKKLSLADLDCTKIIMHRSKPKKLTDINIKKFDMVVIFSPIGVKSFVENFPSITSKDITVAAFGATTQAALKKAGIDITVKAPTAKCPSMIMALEMFFEQEKGMKSDSVTVAEPKPTATTTKSTVKSTKKTVASKSAVATIAEEKTILDKPTTATTKSTVKSTKKTVASKSAVATIAEEKTISDKLTARTTKSTVKKSTATSKKSEPKATKKTSKTKTTKAK